MELKDYVKSYNDVLPLKSLSSLIQWLNTQNFSPAAVLDPNEENNSIVNTNIRKTEILVLDSRLAPSMTNVHWCNVFVSLFKRNINRYYDELKIRDRILELTTINVLKYQNTGFYDFHTDHCALAPRTLSCIYLLNNDYEGGELTFANPDLSDQFKIKVEANKMLIWPSNFLYPHKVNPVKKGIRYSMVCWGL
jgi:hypothetical protein